MIESIRKGFPINIMYWSVNADGTFEIVDGQQRTISICEYLSCNFSVDGFGFHNLKPDEQEAILNYEILIYFCSGTEREKLNCFETINIAGEKLTDQEPRNAVYTGPWLADAKKHFSETCCVAYSIGSDYLNGSPITQEYLSTVLNWISDEKIREYMADHQHDENAQEFYAYFKRIMDWTRKTFPTYRSEMKRMPWGEMFNTYGTNKYDSQILEGRIKKVMADDDVTSKKGIYEYALGIPPNERLLNIRTFDEKIKRKINEQQAGTCVKCGGHFALSEMHADHILPWSSGGATTAEAARCFVLTAIAASQTPELR